MSEILETRLRIESWDEKPYRELADGRKFTRATVVLGGGPDDDLSGTFEGLMYYLPDGTSAYVTVMQLSGTVGGRSGGFVLTGDGGYDGKAARGRSTIVAGSGTGELAGITGSAESVSTHEDYPFMPLTIRYTLG